MGEVRAMKPGMGKDAGTVGDFVTASLADYIMTEGKHPAAAVLVWMDDAGNPCISWHDIDCHSLAFVGAAVIKMALG